MANCPLSGRIPCCFRFANTRSFLCIGDSNGRVTSYAFRPGQVRDSIAVSSSAPLREHAAHRRESHQASPDFVPVPHASATRLPAPESEAACSDTLFQGTAAFGSGAGPSLENWKRERQVMAHTHNVLDMAWGKGDAYLATAGVDNVVCVLTGSNLQLVRRLECDGPAKGVAWDPNGNFLTAQVVPEACVFEGSGSLLHFICAITEVCHS